MNRLICTVSLLLTVAIACSAQAGIRIVRTGATYSTVQAAVNAAIAGDTIEIDSGTYSGSTACALVDKSNLTLRGVGATRPLLDAAGTSYDEKAIWYISGADTTVEFIDFRNCRVHDKNGSGIKLIGHNLTVRDCYFYRNENGILTGTLATGDILLEYCEFNRNGFGDGQSHNLYVGTMDTCTVRYNYFHHGWRGQEVKSRAGKTYVLYNRITCEEDGYSNFEIDIPDGGTTYVIGNLIHQGPHATNATFITYAAETDSLPDQHLYVVNNTFVNTRAGGWFVVMRRASGIALLQNNIFQGTGTIASGPGTTTQVTNWVTSNANLAWPAQYDYRLTAASTGAINAGTAPGTGWDGFDMTPVNQYVHPRSYQARPANGTIDIGAYEYVSPPANQAPYVSAGLDQFTTPPRYTVNLDGTVNDDGLPTPPTLPTTWSKVSGPGTVTFGSASVVDTTATFSEVGTYVLQLAASDGTLGSSDTVTITVNPDLQNGGTITFQQGVLPDATYAGCEDSFMSNGVTDDGEEYDDVNYGNTPYGNGIGHYVGARRSLIKFDVSTIPSSATVSSAKIRLKMLDVRADRTLEAYQILQPWTKLGVTWNNYAANLPWNTIGCAGVGVDRAATACASLNVVTTQQYTWIEIPLPTSLVQGWVAGTTSNNGVLLKDTTEANWEMRFVAEDDGGYNVVEDRPQMVVEFTTETETDPVDLRVDFGDKATNPSPNWNTFAALTTDAALVDYATGSTSHGITMTLAKSGSSMVNPSSNNYWNMSFNGPTWLDASKNAAKDCLYGNWSTVFTVTFKNLDPSSTYTLEVISSSPTDDDNVPFRVNGGSVTYWHAKSQGYDQGQWLTWTDITPDGSNQITLQANNAGLDVNAFLNAVRLYAPDGAPSTPTVTLSADDASIGEDGSPTQFTVSRDTRTDGDLVVDYTISGTATNGADYSTLSGSVTIPNGQTSATISISPIDDANIEADEDVTLTLASSANYQIGTPSSDTVTIVSDDVPSVTLAATDSTATEAGPATGQFTVTRSGSLTGSDLVVDYTISGTATNGTDYTTLSGSVTIQQGQTTATITVTPIDDQAAETGETIILTLEESDAYTPGSPSSGTVTIQDNDGIDLRVDFGDKATNPSPNWNTFAALTTDAALVDYATGSTSHGITMTLAKSGSSMVNPSSNNYWNMSFNGPTWLDASKNAAKDCLYGNWSTVFTVTFKNLDPSSTYTLEVISSSPTDDDNVPFRVNGGSVTYWHAKSQGYDQGQWLTWTDITPDGSNQITLQANNAGLDVNAFLNAVRLCPAANP